MFETRNLFKRLIALSHYHLVFFCFWISTIYLIEPKMYAKIIILKWDETNVWFHLWGPSSFTVFEMFGNLLQRLRAYKCDNCVSVFNRNISRSQWRIWASNIAYCGMFISHHSYYKLSGHVNRYVCNWFAFILQHNFDAYLDKLHTSTRTALDNTNNTEHTFLRIIDEANRTKAML